MSELQVWVIYENPRDYRGKFVVRRHVTQGGVTMADAQALAIVDTLEEARQAVPLGAYNLGRYADDDPAIREVWM